ncbi:transporter [Vibrio sp.]|uniref:transporter n=1 Tax=Vibrio sp. TaxID=678 RepID=UPI003D0B9388
MQNQSKACVEFDYTSFLGANCRKKWTFLEAITSFSPVFGTVWKDTIKDTQSVEDRLWDHAMKSLSAQHTDEANLMALIRLAKLEGIEEIKLVMPYTLDSEQIELIERMTHTNIRYRDQDEFTIIL